MVFLLSQASCEGPTDNTQHITGWHSTLESLLNDSFEQFLPGTIHFWTTLGPCAGNVQCITGWHWTKDSRVGKCVERCSEQFPAALPPAETGYKCSNHHRVVIYSRNEGSTSVEGRFEQFPRFLTSPAS